jgi:hypothetical protein
VFLSGMRIVLMNEQENIFYPVLDVSISEVHFEKYSTSKASKGQTCTFISIFYYNATIGEWEPLMENFKLFILMDAFSNKSCLTINTDRIVNINLSDIVIQNLMDLQKTWNAIEESKKEINDDFFDQIESYQAKEVSKYSVDNVLLKTKEIRASEVEHQQNLEEGDEFASPISIINLTGISLTIHRIQDEEEKEAFEGGNIREPEKVYLPIRVEFEDDNHPIEHIDLSKLH